MKCAYVYNPLGRNAPVCINLNHIQDNSSLIIDHSYNCVCEPDRYVIGLQENVSIWVEDDGTLLCQLKGIDILSLNLTPEIPIVSEPFSIREIIKNSGTISCYSIVAQVDYGNNGSRLTAFIDHCFY